MLYGHRQLCVSVRDRRLLHRHCKGQRNRVDTSGYSKDKNRVLPIRKNKEVIRMMKDELGGKAMAELVALRDKMYAYRNIDKKLEDKHCKCTKTCAVAESFTFDCLFDSKRR